MYRHGVCAQRTHLAGGVQNVQQGKQVHGWRLDTIPPVAVTGPCLTSSQRAACLYLGMEEDFCVTRHIRTRTPTHSMRECGARCARVRVCVCVILHGFWSHATQATPHAHLLCPFVNPYSVVPAGDSTRFGPLWECRRVHQGDGWWR